MKNTGKDYIFLRQPNHIKKLTNIDKWLLDGKASKNETSMMEKVRKAWTDPDKGLKNLKNAPRFVLKDRKKYSPTDELGAKKEYPCEEFECDNWDSIINYEGDPRSWKYKFAVKEVGLNINDIILQYEEKTDNKAWQEYLKQLEENYNLTHGIDSKFPSPLKNDYYFLSPAEDILQINPNSDEDPSPMFFRKTGPTYSDIKQKKVHPCKEVKQINYLLQKRKSVLLVGDTASGKTVVSRVVAKEWTDKKQHVFFLNLKVQQDTLDPFKLLEEIKFLIQETQDSLIIIEDAHLKADLVNTLLSKKTHDWPQMLITARDSYKKKLPRSMENYFEFLEDLSLDPIDTIEAIIKAFFKKKIGGQMGN